MTIGEGPMRGIKLTGSQHTSHAHINGTYEREVQDAIAGMLRPATSATTWAPALAT